MNIFFHNIQRYARDFSQSTDMKNSKNFWDDLILYSYVSIKLYRMKFPSFFWLEECVTDRIGNEKFLLLPEELLFTFRSPQSKCFNKKAIKHLRCGSHGSVRNYALPRESLAFWTKSFPSPLGFSRFFIFNTPS